MASRMIGKRAKILDPAHVEDLLFFAQHTRHPVRNRVIVLLSVKAGLRAAEIANLAWAMVVDPTGEIAMTLELQDRVAKKGSGRVIPIHRELREALIRLREQTGGTNGPVIESERGGPMRPIAIVAWFARAYRAIGLTGCSSHSGRRTFITKAARLVHRAGGSLRDVQVLVALPPALRGGWACRGRRWRQASSPIVVDHAALHRRRYRCSASPGSVDLMQPARKSSPPVPKQSRAL